MADDDEVLQHLGNLDEKTIAEMLRRDPDHPDRFASFFHHYLQAMEDLHQRRQRVKDDQVHQHVDREVQAAQQRAELNRALKLQIDPASPSSVFSEVSVQPVCYRGIPCSFDLF